METSVLAKLRTNVNLGRIGCIDMSLPEESYTLVARKFKLVFGVLESILRSRGERLGAYHVRLPTRLPDDKGMWRRVISNLTSYLSHILETTDLPLIIDAAYLPKHLWESAFAKLDSNRIFVVRHPEKTKIDHYKGELYRFFPRQIIGNIPDENKHWQVREERFSGEFKHIRGMLGNETILLIHESELSKKSCEEHSCSGNSSFMLLHPNMVFASWNSIEIFRQRLKNGSAPSLRGNFLKAS